MTGSAVAVLSLALVASLAALAVSLVALRRSATRRRGERSSALPHDVAGLRSEVQSLSDDLAVSLRRIGVVRYDAFDDMGGRLSWSLALLDDSGTGVVLTSIHGRSDARTYAKPVASWSSEQSLSPEEAEAIAVARGS
jgi:uncharacterized protein DUF4446